MARPLLGAMAQSLHFCVLSSWKVVRNTPWFLLYAKAWPSNVDVWHCFMVLLEARYWRQKTPFANARRNVAFLAWRCQLIVDAKYRRMLSRSHGTWGCLVGEYYWKMSVVRLHRCFSLALTPVLMSRCCTEYPNQQCRSDCTLYMSIISNAFSLGCGRSYCVERKAGSDCDKVFAAGWCIFPLFDVPLGPWLGAFTWLHMVSNKLCCSECIWTCDDISPFICMSECSVLWLWQHSLALTPPVTSHDCKIGQYVVHQRNTAVY